MMLLAIDAGNTQTTLGLFDDARLAADWRLATRREITADELGIVVIGLLERGGFTPGQVEGMIVSCVVPDLQQCLEVLGRQSFDCEPLFVGPGVKTGLAILYENPHEVGADRIVNAVAAQSRHGAPVIVLDFGTATTFDVVGCEGEYLGGVIVPGIEVSAEALFQRAARLHRVDVAEPERVIGRNTEQSIQSGLFHGYAAMVEGLVQRIRDELGHQAPVVATGGLATIFEPELKLLSSVEPQLTLEGLRLIWHKNRE